MTQRMLPLYEGKMLHHYDHRWATHDVDAFRDFTDADRLNPASQPLPRYWVRSEVVLDRLRSGDVVPSLLGFRGITNTTNERTIVAALFPEAGAGNSLPVLDVTDGGSVFLSAMLSSFALDYVARRKLGGSNLNFFIAEQLPILGPQEFNRSCAWHNGTVGNWLLVRLAELTYTAYDMRPFAEDLGDTGEPFVWDPERRFLLRCELDAAFFHLYGIEREAVDYIMETFPIVRSKDLAAHGEYRTKRVILEVFDAMQRAIDSGAPYRTILDPPPGQGPRHPRESTR